MNVVGIGSSAGGTEALKELLSTLASKDDATYIVAQHISPTHVSMLKDDSLFTQYMSCRSTLWFGVKCITKTIPWEVVHRIPH